MKIQAEVSLYVQLADGRRVSVSHTVNRNAGDNPAYAPGAALDALTEAQTAALRGFAAQVRQAPDAVSEPPQRGRSVEEWNEAGGVPVEQPEPPLVVAFENAKRRDYFLNAMDVARVPLDADAAGIRRALLVSGLDVSATDDAELDALQALRRQVQASQSDYTDSLQVDSLVQTLDRLGADNGLGPAQLGDVLLKHSNQTAGFTMPRFKTLQLVSNIRNARKDPER